MVYVYRRALPKKVLFIAGLVAAMALIFGVVLASMHHANAATCTGNDIMFCGFSSRSDFINKVQANSDGHGHSDLQAIYNFYHLTSADYANFAAHAVPGEAMRDGRVIVNGQVVATGGKSIGRFKSFQGSGPFTQSINGVDYFGNVNSQSFADGVSQLAVFVLFDSTGTMKFAVMPSCGNPEFGNVVKTSASCTALHKTPVSGQDNTYRFTAEASAAGNAKITGFTYNFGDGSPTVFESAGTTAVTHTYTQTGTFTATVTVTASVPGNSSLTLPAVSMCSAQVTVAPPPTPTPTPTPTPIPTPTPPVVTPPVVTPPVVAPAVVAPAPVVVLPKTGAGNVIALFSIVFVAGFIGYRQLLIHRRKQ